MDSRQLSRLRQEQEHALFETDSKIKQWEKFKSDYVALKERLKTLPDKITHDVMVPFGSMAFMPGKLVHTNEILVLLGDNWFVDRSAKQAAAIVTRRIKAVEAELSDLKRQRKLLEPRIGFTTDLHETSEEQGVVEITEEFDEEKERKWRDQHRKNVQTYRQTLQNQQKVETASDSQPLSDIDLWARLDELERVERERKELQRLKGDDEVMLTAAQEQEESDEEKSNTSQSDEESDAYEDRDEASDDTGDTTLETKIITFSHTKTSEEESMPSETESIESPRDIYRKFCTPTEPKSILKSSNSNTQKVKRRVKLKEDIVEDSRKRAIRQQQQFSAGLVAFSGTVQEKQMPRLVTDTAQDSTVETTKSAAVTQQSQPKRVSKFKAERQKKMAPT